MPTLATLADLGTLPLWAQALIAARLVRRAALAFFDPASPASTTNPTTTITDARATVFSTCDAIETCAELGGGVHRFAPLFDRASQLRFESHDAIRTLTQSVFWAVDSTRAADASQEFPFEATVTRSMLSAIGTLQLEPRLGSLQIIILVAADADQIRFACSEIGIGRFDPLTRHVFGRLAPVHALTLVEPPVDPESLAR